MLQVNELDQYYGGSHILRGLSFEAAIGEVTCLLGRNGVGKTTLLKCLMGLVPAKNGTITWEGKDISHQSPHQRVKGGIAYVPQGREIFPRLTVEENILLGLSRFSGSQSQIVPEHIYQLFPVLQEMKHRRGGDLSGGQQQQLAIGRALACQPRLLILDEPTEGIQPSVIKEISLVINTLAAKGDMAILLVEQFYDFAAELADSYLVMSRGKIVQRGHGTDMAFERVRSLVAI
ncbi:TPA: urea ABC transporter ATP-binding subunit UrtE [Yersinia enterocolitica]|uniref:High-affinity branched-chain amino acid transport ATP-binding protein livF n=1 Tax=Yersinia enterocolitica W22703 TaxID=913028 RepID=F4MVB9_YEREN|nr:urea ABC transporter ATP-binding subunit UrtE [Yersinia enterocolitica]CBX69777.1 high-affinity branched-chain amino acid transport ATP-binding protein livF [Yersinia enterocolitica W22703]ADZ41905.1 putative ABC transport ATP-binding subunit [Yersinia enterocolitica subsp. palearctica 105.5R(r)]AJJ28452.1 urea ABC transporter, ATP-binding protein UrtE [Yersinia enterocolitica]ALG78068.1 urea ABC transporter ATP-binding protein [Yersinia enterocolitica]KGA64916.1 urea ABC transporter, ATP-b